MGFYGRRSWNFSFRALRLLGAQVVWSLNPGIRPMDDVLSRDTRQEHKTLKDGHHIALIEVLTYPEKIYGDAEVVKVAPVSCP